MQNWQEANMSSGTKGGGDKPDFVKFGAEVTVLRILSETPYARWNHWIPSQRNSIVCSGKDCVVCAINREAKKAGEEKPYGQGKKYAVYVLNKTSNKIEVWDFGQTIFDDILAIMADRKDDGKSMEFDIRVRKTGDKYKLTDIEGDAPSTDVMSKYADLAPISERFIHLTNDQTRSFLSGTTLKELFSGGNNQDGGIVIG